LVSFICLPALSQEVSDTFSTLEISPKYFDAVNKKAENLTQELDKKSKKVLDKMQREEAKLQTKLARIDSLASNNVFKDAEDKYKQLQNKLNGSQSLSHYVPRLDTLATSLKFLEQNPEWLGNVKEAKEKLDEASGKLRELQTKLQGAKDIKQFLKERREYLKQQLEKFGLAKDLKKINKEVYYYSQQINEYKEILNDPNKIEKKTIELLSKTKLFQDFMKKNSMLASLFRMPGDPNDPMYQASLAGLQTRAQVNNLIQNQIAAGGPGAQKQFSQNLQAAQNQLQQLKDKVNKWGGGNSDDIMPEGFKPNSQRTKSFLKRIELGTNIQTQKASYFFPVTTDLGLSIGYKLNDKSVIGIGASYKIGLGSGWNSIRVSHQGVGLRSFIDWKAPIYSRKGGLMANLWISGGYEQNYKTEITNIDQLKYMSAWQQSGLIGISKVVSVKSKVFKKTKMQLLWDFLSYEQVPRAQPVVFRIGYNF
ncbi:MAG TPA: hypothetical protein VFU29_15890, partial [Chitinophagaceae bacterium]|nr:hypothetical protein [Chitinophagaceae bacterium]